MTSLRSPAADGPAKETAASADEDQAIVEARDELVPGIVMLTLRPSTPRLFPAPGSHIQVTVELPDGPDHRSYSLVDLGVDDGRYRIAVRRSVSGRGGSAWMHQLDVGSTIVVAGPFSQFTPSAGGHPSVLLAAGIGITPILGLARALRSTGVDYRIAYAGRAKSQMILLQHLHDVHPGKIDVFASADGKRLQPGELVKSLPTGAVLYVCGPLRLLAEVRAAWSEDGRPPHTLRFETFGTSGRFPSTPFRVLMPGGIDIEVPAHCSMLDALEDAGVDVLYDCLRGECGLCRLKIVSVDGLIDHRDVFLSERQRAENTEICTCVSRIVGRSITLTG